MNKVVHPISPIFNSSSEILILGSFPSAKSREDLFYYAHPQNRFWKVLPRVFGWEERLSTIEEKRSFLLEHRIALWDVLYSCTIEGSSDSSIKNAVPNDLSIIISMSKVHTVLCNGSVAYKLFMKYQAETLPEGITVEVLPSTSPANAAYSPDKLEKIWREKLKVSLARQGKGDANSASPF